MESKRMSVVYLQAVRDNIVEYCQSNLNSPEKAARWMKDILGERDREHLVVCTVDNRKRPASVDIVEISIFRSCIFSIPVNI